jgi:hypothetical protein
MKVVERSRRISRDLIAYRISKTSWRTGGLVSEAVFCCGLAHVRGLRHLGFAALDVLLGLPAAKLAGVG